MKKLISLALIVMMICTLSVTSFAAVTDVNDNKPMWRDICHVSYDQIWPAADSNAASANTNNLDAITFTGELADRGQVELFGWISCTKKVESFSYSINGAAPIVDENAKKTAEPAVLNAAAGTPSNQGIYPDADGGIVRFDVVAPLAEGSQLIEAIVNYVDGTSEVFWAIVATRGEATELPEGVLDGSTAGDGSGTTGDKPTNPNKPATNPETGDVAVVAIAAVAALALAGVVVCKKARV